MNNKLLFPFLTALFFFGINQAHAEFKKGDKLQALVNLHADAKKHLLYTINYQLPDGMIAACTEITVQKVTKKSLVFTANGIEYELAYDKHTKKAGVGFPEAAADFFGKTCEAGKMSALSQKDKDGIKTGNPTVGMTKQGILYAMGRPPRHANADLESNSWTYWQNRFGRVVLEFDDKGVLINIRN